jgi:hypothetical protein
MGPFAFYGGMVSVITTVTNIVTNVTVGISPSA